MFFCATHGRYRATKTSNECPKCQNSSDDTLQKIRADFIRRAKKIHRNKYNYDEFIFVDFLTPGVIRCKTHGRFEQCPAVHIHHKAKCPKCSGSISKGETEWLDYMEKVTGRKIERNGLLIIGNKSIRPDGMDRQRKICYEYHGKYWHGSPLFYKAADMNHKAKKTFGALYKDTLKREDMILKAGYKLIKIWDFEWEAQKKRKK